VAQGGGGTFGVVGAKYFVREGANVVHVFPFSMWFEMVVFHYLFATISPTIHNASSIMQGLGSLNGSKLHRLMPPAVRERQVLVDTNAGALDAAVADVARAELAAGGSSAVASMRIKACTCDVRDPVAVEALVNKDVVGTFGRIDLLWNNAGYQGEMKPLLEYSPKDFQLVQDVNVVRHE